MNGVEGISTEFERSFTKDVVRGIVAFANTQGGTVYIGIDDDGTVIGVESPDKVLLQAVNTVRDSIKPDIALLYHVV